MVKNHRRWYRNLDIDKQVNVCIECGQAVNESWKLYCSGCYRRLLSDRVGDDGDDGDVEVSDGNEVFDAGGQRYVFNGRGWFRRSDK